jgi:type IV pilus assembly protein PilM
MIGLDLGSHAITFVELQHRRGRDYVSRWGSEPLAPNVIEQGRITNRPSLIASLHAFVHKYSLNGASVAMAVNGASVMVKRIHVPTRHQHDLDAYLMWEGAHYISYDPDDVYLDFSVCSSVVPLGPSEDMDLLLVVAKRDAVDERRDVLEEVNVHPVICDVEALAFLNLASLNTEVQTHSSYLLANLDDGIMNVVVVAQGEPLLLRDVSVPSFSNQGVAYGTSEDLGQLQWFHEVQAFQETDSSLSEKMSRFEIVSELKRTVEGARELQPDLDIEYVFLGGSGWGSSQLLEELRQALMLPLSLIDPVASLEGSRGRRSTRPLAPFAGVAGGLALRVQHG